MKENTKKSLPDKGITIIELLVALAIVGFITIALHTLILNLTKSGLESDARRYIQQEGRTAIDLMSYTLKRIGTVHGNPFPDDPSFGHAELPAIYEAGQNRIVFAGVFHDFDGDGTMELFDIFYDISAPTTTTVTPQPPYYYQMENDDAELIKYEVVNEQLLEVSYRILPASIQVSTHTLTTQNVRVTNLEFSYVLDQGGNPSITVASVPPGDTIDGDGREDRLQIREIIFALSLERRGEEIDFETHISPRYLIKRF